MLFANDPKVRTTRACLEWVPDASTAHIGCALSALPVVLPVRYERADDAFLVTLEHAPGIAVALDRSIVALHLDATDPATGDPWWVLVIGSAALAESGDVPSDSEPTVRLAPEVVAARPRTETDASR